MFTSHIVKLFHSQLLSLSQNTFTETAETTPYSSMFRLRTTVAKEIMSNRCLTRSMNKLLLQKIQNFKICYFEVFYLFWNILQTLQVLALPTSYIHPLHSYANSFSKMAASPKARQVRQGLPNSLALRPNAPDVNKQLKLMSWYFGFLNNPQAQLRTQPFCQNQEAGMGPVNLVNYQLYL